MPLDLNLFEPAAPGDGAGVMANPIDIPGTPIFGGGAAQRGYALNRLCFSLNTAPNRRRLKMNPAAYCADYHLDAEQTDAMLRRDILDLIKAGGNVYYLAKLAGVFGLDMQDIGAQQTGMTLDAFKAKLMEAGR